MKTINNIIEINFVKYTIFGIILFLLIFVYFYKIKFFPDYGGDEVGLLNIPYRAVTFGDIQYPVFYPQYVYDAGFQRAYPPISAFSLRVLYHLICGFSAEASRIFSAILMLISTLIVIILCKKTYLKTPFFLIAVATVVIGLTPAMILSARSTRFEQEILFLGVLGTFGLLIWLSTGKSKRIIWFCSGIFLGFAATTHPFGVIFPCALFLSLLLHSNGWHALDHLTMIQRLSAWLGGTLLPVGITISNFLYKFDGFLSYVKDSKVIYSIRNQQFIEIFSNSYIRILPHWVPSKIKAFLYQINSYTFFPENVPIFGRLNIFYTIVTWLSIMISFLLFFCIFKKRKQKNILLPALANYLAIGFFILTFIYPPNQTYYIYLSFFFSTFICVSYFTLAYKKEKSLIESKIVLLITKIIFYLLFLLNLLSSVYLLRTLHRITLNNTVTIDSIFYNQQKLKTKLNLPDNDQGMTIIDPFTWPFAGKNTGSWTMTVSGFPVNDPVAAAYRSDVIDFFINYYPTNTIVQLSPEKRRYYFLQALNKLKLKAILVDACHKNDYFFYAKPEYGNNELQVLIMKNSVETISFASDPINFPVEILNTDPDFISWNILQKGYFVLVLESVTADLKLDKIKFFQENSEVTPVLQSQISINAPVFYLLKLKSGQFKMYKVLSKQVVTFNKLILQNENVEEDSVKIVE